jgi:hypothetical protein
MSAEKPPSKFFRFKNREKLPKITPDSPSPVASIEVQTCVSYTNPQLPTTPKYQMFSFNSSKRRKNIYQDLNNDFINSPKRKLTLSPKEKYSSLKSITPVTYLPEFGVVRSVAMNRKSLIHSRRSLKFSKFLDYSPSKKLIKLPSKIEEPKSDPSLNIKGGFLNKIKIGK